MKVVLVAPWAGVIRRQKADVAILVEQLAKVSGSGLNIVVRIERVGAKTVARPQFSVGRGHELHEADRAFAGDGFCFSIAFGADI